MAIAGYVSRAMLEHYSHIRMAAKRTALDSITTPLRNPPGHGLLKELCTKMATKSEIAKSGYPLSY